MIVERPTIAIIGGTGREGVGLAKRWAAAGYTVIIGSRQMDKATLAANAINEELGIGTVRGLENKDAVSQAEICVLTVVQAAHQQVIEALKGELQGKILVDATSRVDYKDPKPPEAPSAAQQAQEFLGPDVKVVAAFQNVPARIISRAIDQPLEADVLVCSDDLEAAESVLQLAKAAGMHGYYAGRLINAIVVESLTCILISINQHYHVKEASIKISGVKAS